MHQTGEAENGGDLCIKILINHGGVVADKATGNLGNVDK